MPAPPSPKRPRTGSRVPSSASIAHEYLVLHPLPDHGSVLPRPAGSNTSSNTSSEIARDRHTFDQAMIANNFGYEDARFKDVTLTRIYDNVKFPTTVNGHEFTQWCFRVTGHYIVFDDDSLSPEDPYDLAHMKFVILSLWQDYTCALRAHKSEFDLRAAIDALIRRAFDTRYRKYAEELAEVAYETEQQMCLPATFPGTAKADAVVWVPIPSGFNSLFGKLRNLQVFSAEGYRKHDLLPIFIFEAKLQDGVVPIQQISFDLCSAQHQRAALGFKNHQIYGARLVGADFTLYSSKWTERGIFIQRTSTSFDLGLFRNFLKLFIFLCQLADYLYNHVQGMGDELEKDEAGFEERLRNATQNPWRPGEHSFGAETQPSGFAEDEMGYSLGEGMYEGPDDDDDDDDDQEILHLPSLK